MGKKRNICELGMISMALGVPEKARGDRQSHTSLTKTKHPSNYTIKHIVYREKGKSLANLLKSSQGKSCDLRII